MLEQAVIFLTVKPKILRDNQLANKKK